MKKRKQFLAMLLSGLLAMEVLHGAVFAAQAEDYPTQIIENDEAGTFMTGEEAEYASTDVEELNAVDEMNDPAGEYLPEEALQQEGVIPADYDPQKEDVAAESDDAGMPGGEDDFFESASEADTVFEQEGAPTEEFEDMSDSDNIAQGITDTNSEDNAEIEEDPVEENELVREQPEDNDTEMVSEGDDAEETGFYEGEGENEAEAEKVSVEETGINQEEAEDNSEAAVAADEVDGKDETVEADPEPGNSDSGITDIAPAAGSAETAQDVIMEDGASETTETPASNSSGLYRVILDPNGGYLAFLDEEGNVRSEQNTFVKYLDYSDDYTETFWFQYQYYDENDSSIIRLGKIIADNRDPHKKLMGWSKTKNGEVWLDPYDTWFTPEEDTILYAVWSDCHSVVVDANGGKLEDYDRYKETRKECGSKTVQVEKGESLSLSYYDVTPPKGKQLYGWSLSKDGDLLPRESDYVPNVEFVPTGDVTVYARYVNEKESVTLDANGGIFSDVSIDEDFGYFSSDFKQAHLKLNVTDWWPSFDRYMTHSGGSKKVIGWSKTRTGKAVLSVNFNDREFYQVFPKGGPCTLYAVWTDTVVITLNLNGGFAGDGYDPAWDEILQEKVSYASTLRMRAPKGSNLKNFEANAYCYWYGHNLKGWALSKTGKPSQDVALTKDCTLYAIWEKDPNYEFLKKITFKKTAVSMKKGETAYVGCEMKPSFTSAVRWTSSNPSVADYWGIKSEGINRSIMIHAYSGGTATITASALDGSGVKASVKVTVARPKVTKITLDKVSTSLKKGATTTVKVKAVTPSDGTRAVTWTSSNTKVATVDANGKVKAVNAGTAIITATSRDGSGVKANFRVTVKAPVSIAKATVTCPAAKVWAGWALTPVPTVKIGSKTLTKGTDFTLSYKNNKNVGTATVTITGKENYTGTINRTFKINPKPTVISKVTPATGKLTLTWKKQASQTSGYQIQYSSRSDFKTQKTVKVASAAATSRALTGLARKHKYYVRIRTYKQVGSQFYYSTWSGAKSATTK